MRLSRFHLHTTKETPADAELVSHRLMLRAGMIRKLASGLYTWSPLGLRVLRKVETIVREEMNRAGAVELQLPTIQPKELWEETGRWQKFGGQLLKIKDRKEQEYCYSPTAEEAITDFARQELSSYKQLPVNFYQIQTKFRDEIRPRFGVMRGREFLMKDAYSFDLDEASARIAYKRMFAAYLNTFSRLGLKAVPMRADTGPIGGDLSHEFIVLAETGESEVFCDRKLVEMDAPGHNLSVEQLEGVFNERTARYAATEEMHDAAQFEAQTAEGDRLSARGIEVGHIFYFGTKYSAPMKAKVAGPDGQDTEVHMGSYGVGVSRLMGAIIEASHDAGGIIWPDSVAPFDVVVINLRASDEAVSAACEEAVAKLEALGKDVLYDDTDERPGGKFATADLIGVPWQLTIGPKGLADGVVELKRRATGEKQTLSLDAALELLTK